MAKRRTARKPKAKLRFKVWFSQVNQQALVVEAGCPRSAEAKARRLWSRLNNPPGVTDIKTTEERPD